MLIVFDFDGVFATTKKAYLYFFKRVLAEHDWHFSYADMEWALGPKTHTVIALLTKKKPDDPFALRAAKEVDMHLIGQIKRNMKSIKVREGIMETLDFLRKGNVLALRTNSRKAFINLIFRKAKLKPKFDAVITAEDRMDKEYAIRYFMKKFHAKPSETIYIGDMVNDVQVAKRIGCISVAIVGWHSARKLRKEKPDYLIRRLDSLKKIANAAAGI